MISNYCQIYFTLQRLKFGIVYLKLTFPYFVGGVWTKFTRLIWVAFTCV